jgi:hypothetical protein
MKIIFRLCAAAAVLWLALIHVAANDRRLPEFSIVAATGETIGSADVGDANAWLMIYTRVGCAPCDELLNLWTPADSPAPAARVRVIVGGLAPSSLAAMQTQYLPLAGAGWYADPDGSAARALALGGAPAVFGVRDRTIVWTSQGVLPITRTLLAGWR